MKNNIYIYIPKAVYSEFDSIAPFILELHKNNNKLYTFMFDNKILPHITSSHIHKKIFNEYTKVLNFFPKNRSKLFILDYFKQIICVAKFIAIMVILSIKYKNIHIFINWPSKGKNQSYKNNLLYRVIIFMSKIIGGNIYSFPGIQAPFTTPLLERLYGYGAEKISNFEKRAEKNIKKIIRTPETQDAIVYTEEHKNALINIYGIKNKIYKVGIPRLYPSWQDFLKKHGMIDYNSTLKALNIKEDNEKIITILVTVPDYDWHKEGHDFYSLLDEAIIVIKLYFPNKKIFIKAKPHLYEIFQNHEIFNKNNNVYFYKLSLASLTQRSLFCLCIQESSGIFDFLTTGIPVIEYSDYNDEYIKMYPGVNPWKGCPGFFMAHETSKLKYYVKKIYNKELFYYKEELINFYGHKKDLKSFGIEE